MSCSCSNTTRVSDIVTQLIAQVAVSTPLTGSTLLTWALAAMELIETIPALTSSQKLQVLTVVVNQVITLSPLSAPDKAVLQTIATDIIPSFATIICLASKGLTSINTTLEEKMEHKCCVTC